MSLTKPIYEPEEDSFLMQKQVELFAKGRVLDMGTGSGIQAITASKKKNVSEVVAADINEDAIIALKEKIKQDKILKIKLIQTDLFSKIKGKFDVVIFNPPYLPDDESDSDVALDGGKNGDELILKFLKDAKGFLNQNGFILILFSNRSGSETLNRIKSIDYEEKLLAKKDLAFFEELYVYKLIPKNMRIPFAQGKRGVIYKDGKICIKEKNPHASKDSLANEAFFLKILNTKKVGPKFISFDGTSLKRDFIEGKNIEEFLKTSGKKETLKVFIDVLNQCRAMDELKINKTELTNPYKDIIIDSKNKPWLIDFERCKKTTKPQNVTQFLQYVFRNKKILENKKILCDEQKLFSLGKKYKKTLSKRDFENINDYLNRNNKVIDFVSQK